MTSPTSQPSGTQWSFPVKLSRVEAFICKRLKRVGRLFVFLRRRRHELFDESFQEELAAMYCDCPRGTPPKPPALLAMVTLLQAYEQKSDAAAVEEAIFDRRWQMVLNCINAEEPPFSQGVLVDFRRRLVEHNMDRRLLERTVELAKRTGEFGYKQLKVALDSSPLWGAGRVEDTFNLIGHALDVVVDCAASVLNTKAEEVRGQAGIELLGHSSLKAALDIDWDDPEQQQQALERLLQEVRRLREWLQKKLADQIQVPPLKQALLLLEKVISQDLEPDPGGRMRIRQGVAKDRQISVQDPQMRHGRKSRSRVINGYKRHIARDVESSLILAATVRPANEPEHRAADLLRPDIQMFGEVEEFHIDRGYLASQWTQHLYETGKRILAKPWPVRNGNLFPKTAFVIDLKKHLVKCPEGWTAPIGAANVARFKGALCDACPSRQQCTRAVAGRGRSITVHPQETMLLGLRALTRTSEGRQSLRQRVGVEHSLAHLVRRQGPRARYWGVRKNTLDVRRVAAVENLHTLDRLQRAA
jgi:hypothetical protein